MKKSKDQVRMVLNLSRERDPQLLLEGMYDMIPKANICLDYYKDED